MSIIYRATADSLTNDEIDSNFKTCVGRYGGNVASASNLALDTEYNFFNITGNTDIDTFTDSVYEDSAYGREVTFVFASTGGDLVHDATKLVLPGDINITWAQGDVATFKQKTADIWVLTSYQDADVATPTVYTDLRSMTHHATFSTTGTQELGETTTIPSDCKKIELVFKGVSLNTAGADLIQIELGDTTGYAAACAGSVFAVAAAGNTVTAWAGGEADIWDHTAAAETVYGLVTLHSKNGVNSQWYISSNLASAALCCVANGNINNTVAVTHLKITSATGNFDAGAVEVKIYNYDD